MADREPPVIIIDEAENQPKENQKELGSFNQTEARSLSSNSDQGGENIALPKKKNNKPKGEVKCGCGKTYGAYPALYTHIQRKHDGIPPAGSKFGNEGNNDTNKKARVGRPPTWRQAEVLAPSKKMKEEDMKFAAQNDFYIMLGQMGSADPDPPQNQGRRARKSGNLVFDEVLRINENHPINNYFHPFDTKSQIHEILKQRNILLPTIEELLDQDRLDMEDELENLLDKTDRTFIQFLAAIVSWLSEKLRVQYFNEFCLILDVLADTCPDFESLRLHSIDNWQELLKNMNERLTTFDTAFLKGKLYASPVLLTIEGKKLKVKQQMLTSLLGNLKSVARTYKLYL